MKSSYLKISYPYKIIYSIIEQTYNTIFYLNYIIKFELYNKI